MAFTGKKIRGINRTKEEKQNGCHQLKTKVFNGQMKEFYIDFWEAVHNILYTIV